MKNYWYFTFASSSSTFFFRARICSWVLSSFTVRSVVALRRPAPNSSSATPLVIRKTVAANSKAKPILKSSTKTIASAMAISIFIAPKIIANREEIFALEYISITSVKILFILSLSVNSVKRALFVVTLSAKKSHKWKVLIMMRWKAWTFVCIR